MTKNLLLLFIISKMSHIYFYIVYKMIYQEYFLYSKKIKMRNL